MDNTTTQSSHVNDLIPSFRNDPPINIHKAICQAQAQKEEDQKLEVKKANIAEYEKRVKKEAEAKQKVIDEQTAVNKRDRNLINADKKQVLQDKAKNDARGKELGKREDQASKTSAEADVKLKSANDTYLVAESLLKKVEIILNQVAQLQTNSLKEINEQLASIYQKLADHDAKDDAKNDLLLEVLTKLEAPQVKKRTARQNTKPTSQLSLSLDEKFDDTYIFKDVNGDELGACTNMDSVLLAMKHQLYTTNQPFHNVKFHFFIDNTNYDLYFEELHSSNQQDLMQFIQNPS